MIVVEYVFKKTSNLDLKIMVKGESITTFGSCYKGLLYFLLIMLSEPDPQKTLIWQPWVSSGTSAVNE